MVYINQSLQNYNTFNVHALARYFTEIHALDDLKKIIADPNYSQVQKLILGGGSNVLFTKDYDGLVIKNNLRGIERVDENNQHVWLRVAAGEPWHEFVLYCLERNYAGLENLSLIPGTVGAAPIQNIGAYGVEFESVCESVSTIDLQTGEEKIIQKTDCEFAYRDSIFKHRYKNKIMITHVTLKLNKHPSLMLHYGGIEQWLTQHNITEPSIQDVSHAVIDIRQQKLPDPKKFPNAGSFFKNPIIDQELFATLKSQNHNLSYFPFNDHHVKISAAWLIEQCHLKGFLQDGVGISPNHALVVINYSNPNGQAIMALSKHIQQCVHERFGILLRPEVNFL